MSGRIARGAGRHPRPARARRATTARILPAPMQHPSRPDAARPAITATPGRALLLVAILAAAASLGLAGDAAPGDALLPPLSPYHPLGTDDLGRDVLRRIARGAALSVPVAAGATLLAVGIGLSLGLLAALGSSRLDDALTRTAEILGTVPALLLAIVAAAFLPPSLLVIAAVLGATGWPIPFRIARAAAASLRRQEFIRAATALGASPARILVRHLLPGALGPVLASAGVLFGGAVTAEAAIAFVGLGDPAHPSWGRMIAEGLPLLDRAPWLTAFPAAALTLTAVGVGLLVSGAGHGDRGADRVP